jgi:hypothetical protein
MTKVTFIPHGSGLLPRCHLCGKKFVSLHSLNSHVAAAHQLSPGSINGVKYSEPDIIGDDDRGGVV